MTSWMTSIWWHASKLNHRGSNGAVTSQTPARGNQVADAEAYCASAHPEVVVAQSKIGYRTAFQSALIDGRGVQEAGRSGSKGALEIAGLFDEILGLLNS